MSEKDLPSAELFASPEDVITAHKIVEEVLGEDLEVNYMGLPKNVGEMGDERVYANSVVISTDNNDRLRLLMEDYEGLDKVSSRICNETGAACRVFLDITQDDSYFEVEHSA